MGISFFNTEVNVGILIKKFNELSLTGSKFSIVTIRITIGKGKLQVLEKINNFLAKYNLAIWVLSKLRLNDGTFNSDEAVSKISMKI